MGFLVWKNQPKYNSSLDFDFDYVSDKRLYLKELALQTVIGYVAKTVASSEFRHLKDGYGLKDNIYYTLNIKPNLNQSASEFWFDVVYKLLTEREVLIIFDDTNYMHIADSFEHDKFAVFDDTFKSVIVDGYTFNRIFRRSEVIFLKYGNGKLDSFMDSIFKDYTDLFNRMIEAKMFSSQLRAKVQIDANISSNEETRNKIQERIDKMFNTIRTKAVAFLPVTKGFTYEEIYKGDGGIKGVEDLTKIKESLINEVADIIGVPQSLIHGNVSDIDSLMKAYSKFVIDPINKIIADELNHIIIGKSDYLDGECIKIKSIKVKEVYESAEAIDKLIASGAFTPNKVLELFDQDRVDDASLDKYYITKNYTTAKNLEGGE